MDGRERRSSSRYGTPYQPSNTGRTAAEDPLGIQAHERYLQTLQSPARTDTSRGSVTRPFGSGYGGYEYPQQHFGATQMQTANPMQGVEMQYQSYVQDNSRHAQIQHSPNQAHYPSYAHGSMLPSMQQQSIYDIVPLQQRQSAAIEVMANQFSMPPYMHHAESSTVGESTSHYLTSHSDQHIYTSLPMTRSQLQPVYSSHTGDYGMLGQAEHHPSQTGEDDGSAAAAQVAQATQSALEQGRRQYDRHLRGSFHAIIAGRVTEAKEKLLSASRWLLASIVPLGLHLDSEAEYEQRLNTWRELNHCWEALGLKQRDITREVLRSKQPAVDILTHEGITELINELVSMCDQIENYGLVDYEMGFWEEQIVAIFISCLDLLEQDHPSQRSSS